MKEKACTPGLLSLAECQDDARVPNESCSRGTCCPHYQSVSSSSLREKITAGLPADDFLVDNDLQQVEHSVEAIVPFLQAYNRGVESVSILVPHMDFATMDRLASYR